MKTDRKKYAFPDNHQGFTLIEVLIAMVIFSIGILAVASMQLRNTKNNTTGNITTRAAMLARAKMEEVKSKALADMADENETSGIFARETRVDPVAALPNARQITVTVSWTRRGQNRRVVFTSIARGNGT